MKKMTYMLPQLSIVVPVFNEAENLYRFYHQVTQVMEQTGESYEIILINDGSTDESLKIMLSLRHQDLRIKIINLSRNFGKEIALSAGIDHARGKGVIPIDADMQDPPEVIPQLIAKWKQGFDIVYAIRKRRKGESFCRKWTAALFYHIIKKLTNCRIPLNTGDFRLIDRKAVEALKKLKERNRFMKGLFSWIGFRQTGVFYDRDPRYQGRTKWNYHKLFYLAVEGITSFSQIPLRLAAWTGFILFFLDIFLVIAVLLSGSHSSHPGFNPWPIVIILFLASIQMIFIGIMGEYIGKIYMETKQRQLYYIRECYGIKQTHEPRKKDNKIKENVYVAYKS